MPEETTPQDQERLEAEHLAWIAKAEAVIEHIVPPASGHRPRTRPTTTSGGELERGALLRT
jgi:hypothetical protein